MEDPYLHCPSQSGEHVNVLHVCTAKPVLARMETVLLLLRVWLAQGGGRETAIPVCPALHLTEEPFLRPES